MDHHIICEKINCIRSASEVFFDEIIPLHLTLENNPVKLRKWEEEHALEEHRHLPAGSLLLKMLALGVSIYELTQDEDE